MSKREQRNAAARLKRAYARYDKRDMERYGNVDFHVWKEHYLEHGAEPFAQCYYGRLDENGKCKHDPPGYAWGKPPAVGERIQVQTQDGPKTLERRLGTRLWVEIEEKN